MSKISIAILYIVIIAIIIGMYLEVPYLTGGPGAFLVIALVYSFVVAKRELALLSEAMHEEEEPDIVDERDDQPVIPDWLKEVPGQQPSAVTGTTPLAPQPSRILRQPNRPASPASFGRAVPE